jgi:MYXO-CTERM domain-containing protein
MERVLPAPAFALGLGDLVYDDGDWADYDPKLFQPYARLFARAVFWPTIGNHDAKTENGAPYFDAFHLPTATGAPGKPSGTEHYYSFDHGMAHFTCLDSELASPTPGGAMYAWAEADLANAQARGKRWLFVYMHHPPYSRGTHDSTQESDLIQLHDDLVPLFERMDVDMVLAGHSHVYERSFLAKGDAVLQGDASEYSKIVSPDGTLYLVTGCGGKTGSGPLDHPLMARSYGSVAGFSVIDVSWSEVRGRFVERDGRTTDLFTLRRAADTVRPHVAAIEARGATALALVFDEPVQAGVGPAGAENPANYGLSNSAAVVGATLDSDRSTVVLATTALTANRAYTLDVSNVSDPAGRAADERVRFVLGAADPGGPPAAGITARVRTANAPALLSFSGESSSDAGGTIAAYLWDFGDGSATAAGVETSHTYTTAGEYDLTLTVRDDSGLEGVARVPIRIHTQGSPPLAALSASTTQVAPGRSVRFGSGGSSDPDGGALAFSWDFGDPASGPSNVSGAPAPSHAYSAAGTYTATLVVTDDEGSSTLDTATITVDGAGVGSGPGTGFGCYVTDAGDPRGDPLLAAILLLALLGLSRRREPPRLPVASAPVS